MITFNVYYLIKAIFRRYTDSVPAVSYLDIKIFIIEYKKLPFAFQVFFMYYICNFIIN